MMNQIHEPQTLLVGRSKNEQILVNANKFHQGSKEHKPKR